MDSIQQILKEKNILCHKNQGVTVATVANLHEGFGLAKEILYEIVDSKTVLYLSGGSTPKALYEKLSQEEKLSPGAVGVVDERFGLPFHDKSNEKMIRETGLLNYTRYTGIPVYLVLQSGKSCKETAQAYDEKIRELNSMYHKSVAILGIGTDGHTAGLPVQSSKFKVQSIRQTQDKSSELNSDYDLVTEYDDISGPYGERVTMTFLALSMMDVLLVLAFGSEKKMALEAVFQDGSESEVPARFFTRSDIAKKTLLITDQRI